MFSLTRRNRKWKIGLSVVVLIALVWFYFVYYPLYRWRQDRAHLLKLFSNHNGNGVVNPEAACTVPNLNPFSDEVLHLMKNTKDKCKVKRYGRIVDKTFVLEEGDFMDVTIQYIRRAPKSGEISDDFAVTYSKKITVPKKDGKFQLRLEENHIRVEMKIQYLLLLWKTHREYHSHVNKYPSYLIPLSSLNHEMPVNIAIQMIDSESRANFQRQAVKTMEFLENDDDAFVFESNSILGDGTPAQIMPLLTGVGEEDQFETRRGFNGTRTVDGFNWIFQTFAKAGYATLYSEDDMDYGTFNLRMNGFAKPPSLWYPKPMWLSRRDDYDMARLCSAELNVELLKQFNEMFQGYGRFAFALTARFCHNEWNSLQNFDDQMVDLLKYYKNEGNTIFVLFGDHGSRAGALRETVQGKLEEQIPFLGITVPSWFKKKHPDFHKALRRNTRALTTYYDVYAMFRHVLTYPELPTGNEVRGKSLFTDIPLTRTCASEGIKNHICSCFNYQIVSASDPEAVMVTRAIIDYINQLLAFLNKKQKTCALLELGTILRAGVNFPNKGHNVNRRESVNNYQIVFTVKPSGGKFETNANLMPNGDVKVDPYISRINMYGDQPKCIATIYPHLRAYCYCI